MTAERPAVLQHGKQEEAVADTVQGPGRAGPQDRWTALLFLLHFCWKTLLGSPLPVTSPNSLPLPPSVHISLLKLSLFHTCGGSPFWLLSWDIPQSS